MAVKSIRSALLRRRTFHHRSTEEQRRVLASRRTSHDTAGFRGQPARRVAENCIMRRRVPCPRLFRVGRVFATTTRRVRCRRRFACAGPSGRASLHRLSQSVILTNAGSHSRRAPAAPSRWSLAGPRRTPHSPPISAKIEDFPQPRGTSARLPPIILTRKRALGVGRCRHAVLASAATVNVRFKVLKMKCT